MSHHKHKRSAAVRAARERERLVARSPMVELLGDAGFVRSVAKWAWQQEVASAGGVSRYLEANAPEVLAYLEELSPGSTRAARSTRLLSVPGDVRRGTLARLLGSPDGDVAAAALFVRQVGAEHARLKAAGLSEERIAEGLSALAPELGDAVTWGRSLAALEPVFQGHNSTVEQIKLEEDILDRMAEGDKAPLDPLAELEQQVAAETDPARRAELAGELEGERNKAAVADARRAHGETALERKVRIAVEAAELAEVKADPRAPYWSALARGAARGELSPKQLADASVRLEEKYAKARPPGPRYGDRLDDTVRRAVVLSEEARSLEAGLPPMLDDADRAALQRHADAAMRARASARGGGAAAPQPRSLTSRVAEAHDRVAWEDRMVDNVVGKVAERVGAKPAAPAVPKGSSLEQHVAAAYDSSAQHAERPLAGVAGQAPPDEE